MIKLFEEFTKKREIYHFSESLDSLNSILYDDRLISGDHSASRYGLGYENISFTWNPDLWDIIYAGDRDYRYKVKICFDYDRMSKGWKFEPFDYGIPEEKEERIIGNEINGINKYITKVYISNEFSREEVDYLKIDYPKIKFYWAKRKKFKEEDDLFEEYSIDDNWYLYKDGIRQFSSTSKSDLIN